MESKLLFFAAAIAAMSLGCVSCRESDPDMPNEEAMRSTAAAPLAAVWQAENAKAIEEATSDAALASVVADAGSAAELLSCVKGPYATDPVAATKIAAVTQYVMRPSAKPADRGLWHDALVRAAATAADEYRRNFYLDQIRLCNP